MMLVCSFYTQKYNQFLIIRLIEGIKKSAKIIRFFTLSFLWWFRAGSNRRHMDFQSIALPTELRNRCSIGYNKNISPLKAMQRYDTKHHTSKYICNYFRKIGKKSAKKHKKVAKTA